MLSNITREFLQLIDLQSKHPLSINAGFQKDPSLPA